MHLSACRVYYVVFLTQQQAISIEEAFSCMCANVLCMPTRVVEEEKIPLSISLSSSSTRRELVWLSIVSLLCSVCSLRLYVVRFSLFFLSTKKLKKWTAFLMPSASSSYSPSFLCVMLGLNDFPTVLLDLRLFLVVV